MANPIVLFVSEEKLKSFTSINYNVSPADLQPFVLQAQDVYLQNYIGATYYHALQTRILANTLTVADQSLLDNYIGNALVNFTLYMALPFLKYKILNKSVMNPTSESSAETNFQELTFIMNQVKQVAESYTKQMILWMQNHPSDYPEYITQNYKDGIIADKGNPYTAGLVIPHQPYSARQRARKRLNNGGNDSIYFDCYEGPTN